MYTIAKILPTIRQAKLIGKKEFIATVFDLEDKAFVVHIAFISQDSDIHPSQKAQIASLKADETPTSVFSKYANFADVFSKNLAAKLLKYQN